MWVCVWMYVCVCENIIRQLKLEISDTTDSIFCKLEDSRSFAKLKNKLNIHLVYASVAFA